MTPKTVLGGLAFPEGPRWHEGALYFSDMHDGVVWRLTAEGDATKIAEVPTAPSGLGWLPDGSLCVVSMLDRRLLRVTAQGLALVADLSSYTAFPINDMAIDGHGRAYIGSFGFDLMNGASPSSASLFCVQPGGTITTVAKELLFPNGIVITPGGQTLILAETFAGQLTAFSIEDDGTLTNRRLFAPLGQTGPDGICLDEEGGVWVACANDDKMIRVIEGGEITDTIPLPDRHAYACMLGGADRRDLYICTALDFHPQSTLRDRAGRIEVVRVEIPGAGWP